MRRTISRRAALVGAGCLVAAGAMPAWRAVSEPHAAIRAMIRKHLRGAAVGDGAIDAFVADFLSAHPVRANGIAVGNVCDALGIGNAVQACTNNADYLRRIEERVIDLFVRSTDLLASDRRAGDPIRYVAFWDPYSGACRNPLADLTLEV
jgi:hypothetical protein